MVKNLVDQEIYKGFISATTFELEMYQKMGFKPIGDVVGKEGAYFQPMVINLDSLRKQLRP